MIAAKAKCDKFIQCVYPLDKTKPIFGLVLK